MGAVVVAAVVVTLIQVTGSSAPSYRVATASDGSVAETLDSVGSITPEHQANVNFLTGGTVDSVAVTVGQHVTAGQTLATLETSPFQQAIVEAQATLAKDQARLASDESSETSATTTAGVREPGPATGGVVLDATETQDAQSAVTQAQQQLVTDQQVADQAQQAATAALDQATSVCETAVSTSTSATTSASGAVSATPTTSTTEPGGSAGDTTTATPAGSSATTCAQTLAQAQSAQKAVATALATVATDETALSNAIAAAAAGSGRSGGGGSPSGSGSQAPSPAASTGTSGGSSTRTPTGAGGSGGSGGSGSAPASATDLASDQASIDVASAQLAADQQRLADTTLVSPITGTVAAVAVSSGSSVSAGASTSSVTDAAFTVLGAGSYVMTADIGVSDLTSVKVGQSALVTPDATNHAVAGTVLSIGALSSTSSGSTSYPVEVAVGSAPEWKLLSGADAEVSVVIDRVQRVLTVPTSAVHTTGSVHTVIQEVGGTVHRTRVHEGLVGDLRTQITSGLAVGDTVVLADRNEAVPGTGASTTARSGLSGLSGGLGGGGFGGGGFGGGGFGGGGFGGGGLAGPGFAVRKAP